jgi:leucyl aminopeptidase
VQAARKERIDRFAYEARPPGDRQATIDAYEVAVSNMVMADFEFDNYKAPSPEGPRTIKEVQLIITSKEGVDDIKEGVRRGVIIGEETNACRALQNTPGGDMTPDILANHAIATAKRVGGSGKNAQIKVAILGVPEMKKLNMGGVLGVGKGSAIPPRFIVMEYMPNMKGVKGPNTQKPIVLAGKGVTFDTGGLNLKPSDHIYEMHMDMSGGAAVIHALAAAVQLGIKRNIVALVPAVENMPSGSSYRPGDVLRTMNGKTIEVLNTDAEGRVILADTLEYAKKYDPAIVIDVATLTGAAMVALGMRYTGIFTTDKTLEERFRALGDAVFDPVWPLPMNEDYENDIRGTFGDWANAGKPGVGGGASTAATFLWQFTKDAKGKQAYPWIHLDIAPRMTSIEEEKFAKGGLGTPVRLLVRFLEE